jgi:hypothetical protein
VSSQLPDLSRTPARTVALWSSGVVLAQRCGQTSVAATLALLVGQRETTVRQRRREWCYDAEHTPGAHRRAVAVETCCAPLLGGVLRWWAPGERRLALALDATTRGDRFVVLALCVLSRGGAVPVAGAVVSATAPGAWRPHGERRLAPMRGAVPAGWLVVVLADRGLYAPWLFQALVRLGWHPGLRLNGGAGRGLSRRPRGGGGRPLAGLLSAPGRAWCGAVFCFREQTVRGTLLARWEAGYREGWLVLSDLPPAGAEVAWDGLRVWVECGFKDLKRDGWQGQRTRMRAPERATRCWRVLAVATRWAVSVGGAAAVGLPASSLQALPPNHGARRRATGRPAPRLLSGFRRGVLVLVTAAAAGVALPAAQFLPEPWPTAFRHNTYP